MELKIHSDQFFEFYFPDADTHLRVEVAEEKVVIRATRNTFSDQRKARFLRQLAAEGFISDRYQWVSSFESEWSSACWVVDTSWVHIPKCIVARARRFMIRLLISAVVLLLGMTAALLFRWI